MVFQFWPSLAWNALSKFVPCWCEMHYPLLSETVVSETIVCGGHQEMDMRDIGPVAKIPHHKSNGINGLSIGGLSINIWQVAGHFQIPFRDTLWTCDRWAKTSGSCNFEFYKIFLVCLGMGNMGTPTTTPPFMVFQFYPSLAWNALSLTKRKPIFRNHHIRRSPGNGQEREPPPKLKSHVMNPTKSTVHQSKDRSSIYGELQFNSKYHWGTLSGLVPDVQKMLGRCNFEFR